MSTSAFVRPLRVAAVLCLVLAAATWLTAGRAAALGPDKTAWYDALGLQGYTGETTPSLASNGQLEVAYVPASVNVPSEKLPTVPVTPPTLPSLPVGVPAPSGGKVGGMTLGNTLAFAAVEYPIPLLVNGQTIDPASIRGVLTLALSSRSLGMSNGEIVACPTTETLWAAGADQPATQASAYDCAAGLAVSGNYDAASHTISFILSSAQEYQSPTGPNGTFSLVLAPGSSPTGPFTAVFDPPGASSFVITGESPASNADENLASGATGYGDASGIGFGGVSGITTPTFSSIVGVLPTGPSTTPGGTTSTAPGGTGATALGTPEQVVSDRGLSSSSQRTIAVILLAALGAGLWMSASNTARQPRSLRRDHASSGD